MSDYSSFMNRQVTCEDHIAEVSVSIRSRITQLVEAAKTHLSNRKNRRIDNKTFDYMLHLDDAMLKDIGVSRGDVAWAGSLPVATNASLELAKQAVLNRSSMAV